MVRVPKISGLDFGSPEGDHKGAHLPVKKNKDFLLGLGVPIYSGDSDAHGISPPKKKPDEPTVVVHPAFEFLLRFAEARRADDGLPRLA